jgi:hypothetical protein
MEAPNYQAVMDIRHDGEKQHISIDTVRNGRVRSIPSNEEGDDESRDGEQFGNSISSTSPGTREKPETKPLPMEPKHVGQVSSWKSNQSLHIELLRAHQQRLPSGSHGESEAETRPMEPNNVEQVLHQKPNNSLQTLHMELLRADRQLLSQQVSDLKKRLELVQKRNAHERSKFLMKQFQLTVQIEMLQEDKVFLLEKHDTLGRKLLDLHMQRIKLMEKEG